MEEIWKPIYEYEGLYEISNLGRVKSLEKFRKNGKKEGNGYIQKEKILIPHKNKKTGYTYVSLRGKKSKYLSYGIIYNTRTHEICHFIPSNLNWYMQKSLGVKPNTSNKTSIKTGKTNNAAARSSLVIRLLCAFFILSSSDVKIALAKSKLLNTNTINGPNNFK